MVIEYLKYKRTGGVKNSHLLQLMERKWGINNDRIKGSYINHFECMVCNRIHANIDLINKKQPIIKYESKLEAYGNVDSVFFFFINY